MKFAVLMLSFFAVIATPDLFSQDRLRPPAGLRCDRNHLTAFTGTVTAYKHSSKELSITVHTDEDTNESFRLSGDKQSLERQFLMQAGEFRSDDWAKIEDTPKHLRSGMRVAIWICESPKRVTVDWRPPED